MSYQIRTSSELLPACASCKRVCDHAGHWHAIDDGIRSSLEGNFTHTICPECARQIYPDVYRQIYSDDEDQDTPCMSARRYPGYYYNW